MKIKLGILAVILSAFLTVNPVFSEVQPSKVAVVNVQDIVNSSAKVQALKKQQEAKAKEFITFIEKARKEVASTTDLDKKKSLEEKYTKEFNAKKAANDKEYAQKLAEIDTAISNQIANVAKLQGYDLVITRGIVLYGGDDITEAVKTSLAASEKTTTKKKK